MPDQSPLVFQWTEALEMSRVILERTQVPFELLTDALAKASTKNGRLDASLVDEHQPACFDLAWASAELLAARTSIEQALTAGTALPSALALVFAVEAISTVLAKLESISLTLTQDLSVLQSIACSVEWASARRLALQASMLQQATQWMLQADGEFSPVPMSDELAMAQDSFRRFAQEVVLPQAESIHRENLTVPETLLEPMREMGVFGLSIPEKFGGSAPNDREDTLLMVAVTEALSEASLAAAGSLITRPEILSRALLAGGTQAQKEHWLPKLAMGQPLCAIAITEPDYGSDVASLVLRGTPTAGGWLLNGAKTWCTFAGKAGVLMVVTRTDPDRSLGHRGLSLLLVEKPSSEDHAFEYVQEKGGKLSGKAIPTIGYRGMHSFDLFFQNYFVPDANVIGEKAGLGKGFYLTMAGMVGGRMQTAARACGVMRAALRAAVRYSQDRQVFDAPLVSYGLTQSKLVKMAARYAACRQLTYAMGRKVDEGGGRMEASLCKLLACRSAEMLTREALQLHGGMGYAEEAAVSRYFVDARVLSIFEGAEETLALKVIARGLLEQALKANAPEENRAKMSSQKVSG